MERPFRLYWLRETGCDAGTPMAARELDGAIRAKVMELAQDDPGPITILLPFLDRREWARRSETMRAVELARQGGAICAVNPTMMTSLKDRAAELKVLDPAWTNAPREGDRGHSQAWRAVSIALQKALRVWLPEIYFRDPARFENRDTANTFLVYAASRPFSGRSKTEFTYDIADSKTLPEALRMTKQALRNVLERTEQRLREDGRPELARRYSAVWQEDIAKEVQRQPRWLLEILGSEATLVNAAVRLGSQQSLATVKPFAKAALSSLRRVCGEDFRCLAPRLLQTATETLARENTKLRRPCAGKARGLAASPSNGIARRMNEDALLTA